MKTIKTMTLLLIGSFILLSGCATDVRKLYIGEKKPSEISIVHVFGPANVTVEYINDRRVRIYHFEEKLYMLPGKYKIVLERTANHTYDALGSRWDSYYFITEIDLEPGMTYVPFTSDNEKVDVNDICLLKEKHNAEGAVYKKNGGKYRRLYPSNHAKKVGCGQIIKAKVYKDKNFNKILPVPHVDDWLDDWRKGLDTNDKY